jgi:hypothetical protein
MTKEASNLVGVTKPHTKIKRSVQLKWKFLSNTRAAFSGRQGRLRVRAFTWNILGTIRPSQLYIQI